MKWCFMVFIGDRSQPADVRDTHSLARILSGKLPTVCRLGTQLPRQCRLPAEYRSASAENAFVEQGIPISVHRVIETGTVILPKQFGTILETIERTHYRGHGAQEGQEGQEADL